MYGEQEGSDEDQLSHLNRKSPTTQPLARPTTLSPASRKHSFGGPFKCLTSRVDFLAGRANTNALSGVGAELLVFTQRGALPTTPM